MALNSSNGYVASGNYKELSDPALPIFNVEKVQLQFSISSDFVAAQVGNNVLVLALSTGRILRIDLDSPADIDDIDLPKKTSETGLIRRMFLDPSASHLIINTTLGENYYLHTQSRQPKALSKLKGVGIESIAWNPSQPTASTREILIGASDGKIYETYIEPSHEFYRSQDKYLKSIYQTADGPVTGLFVDLIPDRPDFRKILITSQSRFCHFAGRIGRHGQEGSGSIFAKLFETEAPTIYEIERPSKPVSSALGVSPDSPDLPSANGLDSRRIFAWLSVNGLFYGRLHTSSNISDLGSRVINESKTFLTSQVPPSEGATGRKRAAQPLITDVALTQWHILCLVDSRILAINRLDGRIVFDQVVLEPGQNAVRLLADLKKNTFWLFTTQEIYEIVVNDEDRDVWKVMLAGKHFDAASQFARTSVQKDAVATASGDYLVNRGQFFEAAGVYGRSSKPFEEVALILIDHGEQDALRRYLLTKLTSYKKSSVMQRTMIASWLVEVFMSKLNSLDDTITTKAELSETANTADTVDELGVVRTEYQDYINRFKGDLDRKTTYDIIRSHGREQELLFYATAINDYNFVLSYWVQRERWSESMAVLKKQTIPAIFYRYASVLMTHVAPELVEVLMRHPDLNPRNLIPALLNYNKDTSAPSSQNQAARYLLFVINKLHSTDAAIHNTLISIYASARSASEAALLSYLESQSLSGQTPLYDADFALRLCIQHNRIQSCVHIYSSMGQYAAAVTLALKHNEIDLASLVADRPDSKPSLRKKLWLAVANKVISQQGSGSIKTAIEFLKRCELLKIEDLIPFFPDFVIIDDFKEEICNALESYSRHIDTLKSEMDESAATAESIKADIKALDRRYAIVEPGERCYVCRLPLLARQFFVFPCQHGFHSECLGKKVLDQVGLTQKGRIRELQAGLGRGVGGERRERDVRELDALVAQACILCSDFAIKLIEEPLITKTDDKNEWAL